MNQEMVTIRAFDHEQNHVANYCWLNYIVLATFPTIIVQAPAEENFDQIVAMLKDTTASCPVIFNCQVKFQEEQSLIGI